jgi:hypothetical protein
LGLAIRKHKKIYVIRNAINPNHGAIVFEYDQQSEAALLRDFPPLRRTGIFAFGARHYADSEQAAGCLPETLSAVLYRLWSQVHGLVSLRSSASA